MTLTVGESDGPITDAAFIKAMEIDSTGKSPFATFKRYKNFWIFGDYQGSPQKVNILINGEVMTIDAPKAASSRRNLNNVNSPQILEFGKYLWISSDKNGNAVGFDKNDEGVVIAIASITQILPDARGWIDFYKVVTTSGDYPKYP